MARSNRWPFVLAVALFLIPLGVRSALAQTFTPVFTKQYVRAAGAPLTVSDSFTVCDPKGTFRLVVLNGPGGQGRISSGSLLVNEVEVIQPQDFNQQVAQITRPLTNVVQNNQLSVRLASGPAAAIQVSVEGIQNCGIRITSPAPGSTLTEGVVLVRGTVPVPPGGEQVGVTVNGVAGLVERDQFAAVVPVDPTVTSLTANANELTGTVSHDTIAVTVVPAGEPAVRLQANRPGGVAPLAVSFELSTTVGIVQVALDADGDGVVDFQGSTIEGQTFTYGRSGIFVPTVRATDAKGTVYTATTFVHVADPVALDARLQAVWSGFKDAMRAGDVARAAGFLHAETRARYQTQLARLSAAALANIDQQMTTIRLVAIGFAGAEYEMLRLRNGQPLSFAVWFQLDQDGLWRLRRF